MVTSNSTSLVSRTVRTPTSPTWGRWVAVAAFLALAVGVGTVYVVTTRPSSAHNPAVVSAPPRKPVLTALAGSAPVPSAAGVAAALAASMRDPALGGHVTGQVVDAETGQVLLDRDASRALPPASTVKLLTAAAALRTLGPTATLDTGVVRDGSTLYLIGGGDVTLRAAPAPAAASAYPPAADMTSLATQTASALGTSRTVRLCLDTSAWPPGPAQAPGWNSGYFSGGDIAHLSPLEVDEGSASVHHAARAPIARVADPTAAAGIAFAAALRRLGVTVTSTRCRASAPPSALGVASVSSPPVSALVQRMLTLSDNDLAESLGRAVARHEGQPANFAGEATAVSNELHSLGVDVTDLTLYDASGLSHLDRVSPHTLVQVVQLAAGNAHPELRVLLDGMPIAGLTGTLATRYRRGPSRAAAGVARAKTGTLAGVNTITGFVVDADARLLVFAFMTDRASGPAAAEAALDRLVARLATCGCR